MTSLQAVNFYQMVQAAMKIEKLETKSQEGKLERKFSRGSSSFSKRARESQIESVQGFATRGRRQGPTMTQGSGRGTSTRQKERPEFLLCHKCQIGICRRLTGGCFRCGSMDHLITNCPQGSGISRNPQGSSQGGSNVPPSTRVRGRGRGSSRQQGRSFASETVNHLNTTMTPTQAYAMRAREDQVAPEVITGKFTLYNNEMHALVDPGSTHSYICIEQLSDKLPLVEPLAYDMLVTSPLGHNVKVD